MEYFTFHQREKPIYRRTNQIRVGWRNPLIKEKYIGKDQICK